MTADHYLTATAVAKGIQLITTKQHVLIGKMPAAPSKPPQPAALTAAPVEGAVGISETTAVAMRASLASAVPVQLAEPKAGSAIDVNKHRVRFATKEAASNTPQAALIAALPATADASSGAEVKVSEADETAVDAPRRSDAVASAALTAESASGQETAARSSRESAMSRAAALARSSAAAATAVIQGASANAGSDGAVGPVRSARTSAMARAIALSGSSAKTPHRVAEEALTERAAETSAEMHAKAATTVPTVAAQGVAPVAWATANTAAGALAERVMEAAEQPLPGKPALTGAGGAAHEAAALVAETVTGIKLKPHTATDVFGNEVSKLDEEASRQLAAADASNKTAFATDNKVVTDPSSVSISKTDQSSSSSNKPTPAVAVVPVSPADPAQNVLVSAAVQNSALYAQLTCTIATSEDVKMATAAQAFTAAAEGMQCVITGAVLDFLLEHAEPAVLETVLRSTVVYARMKAHQKAQLVCLLGTEGLKTASGRVFQVNC